jgi:hypothetical protein
MVEDEALAALGDSGKAFGQLDGIGQLQIWSG